MPEVRSTATTRTSFRPKRSTPSATQALRLVARQMPLDAKRSQSRRAGPDQWFPYYAGFSPEFARIVLQGVPLPRGATVLDPWNGSGTTTHVADQLGFRAVGIDLNPVATLVASARLARPRDAEHVLGLARRLSKRDKDIPSNPTSDPLAEWLRPTVIQGYRSIQSGILADLATGSSGTPLEPIAQSLPPLAAFLVLALMRAARSLAAVRTTTNPTWITPGDSPSGTWNSLSQRWLRETQTMASQLAIAASAVTMSEAIVGDSRSLPVESNSVDLVLTSPPYCTRIDYVINTSFELAALGIGRDSEQFATLRRASMGSPLVRGTKRASPPAEWPHRVRSLLAAIESHPSKASQSYYYKTYWHYFDDCAQALRELHRCLKPGATAVLVLQSSYYKNLYVDLPQLYCDMGTSIGFRAEPLGEVAVRRALAQINSRSMKHRTSTQYREAIIALEKCA